MGSTRHYGGKRNTGKGRVPDKRRAPNRGRPKGGMRVFILLDRTGSMAQIWSESVNSINVFVDELAGDNKSYRITLAAFDLHNGLQFDVLRDAVPIEKWQNFAENETYPRGSTPLLDSLVRIIAMAERSNPERAVIVVMTDGHENSSREVDLRAARAAVKRAESKGWHVVFLGADFNTFTQANDLNVMSDRTMNMARGHQSAAMRISARKSSRYFTEGESFVFNSEDRRIAGEGKVK